MVLQVKLLCYLTHRSGLMGSGYKGVLDRGFSSCAMLAFCCSPGISSCMQVYVLPVTSRNTLDCADSSCTVHMTSCTRHHLLAAPSHLGPAPCAWNLSPRFVSLFGPLSHVYFLSHLCLYVTYLFMIRFLLCPFVSPCPYVSTSIPDPFVRPSSFQPTYISLVCHVCLLSLYIDFDSTSTVTLCLHAT